MDSHNSPEELLLRRYEIPLSSPLHANEPKLSLHKFRGLKEFFEIAKARQPELLSQLKTGSAENMSYISEDLIGCVLSDLGEAGLYKLHLLARTTAHSEFIHFIILIEDGYIFDELRAKMGINGKLKINFDNDLLMDSPELFNFRHNVVNQGLSRYIYNPGCREGWLVYGIGGPKILVSLPFRGATRFTYDVYNNSLEVASSLAALGYSGRYLFLDSLDGFNLEFFGKPAWLLWFSIIAAHSDLVIFVQEKGKELTKSQRLEAGMTPNRVGKKIVEIPELMWAKIGGMETEEEPVNFDSTGKNISQAEWERVQLAGGGKSHFINAYKSSKASTGSILVLADCERMLQSSWSREEGFSPLLAEMQRFLTHELRWKTLCYDE